MEELGPPADPESVARGICLRLLTARAHSRSELAAALQRRRVPPDAGQAVLDRFVEVGLIDDAAFATSWVGSRHAGRGLARPALAAELRARGIAAETVSAAVSSLDPETEQATARRLVDRRLSGLVGVSADVRRRRLEALLARKGYPAGMTARVVADALRESDH